MSDEERKAEIKRLEQMLGAPAHNRSGRDPRFNVMGWALLMALFWVVLLVVLVNVL